MAASNFTYPPFNKNSDYYNGMPVGIGLDFLDKIILVGAKDYPVLRILRREPVTSIKAVWITDKMRPQKTATQSAKKYVEDLQPPEPNNKQETENVVQLFMDEVSLPRIAKSLTTVTGEKLMEDELAKRSLEHTSDLEGAFFSDTSPFLSTDDTQSNVVGGVWHYVPATSEFDHRGALGAPTKILDLDDILNLQQAVWEKGGDPQNIYLTARMKKEVNRVLKAEKLTVIAQTNPKLADLLMTTIETDFGITTFNLSRTMSNFGMHDRMLCMDEEYVSMGMLNDTCTEDVTTSKTAEVKRIFTDATFLFRNGYSLSAGYGFIS